MKIARFDDIGELTFDRVDAILKHTPVEFDLRFARTAKKAAATTLAFQVRPRADEPSLLIREMSQLNLQHAFTRSRACTEDFENEPCAVENFRIPRFLKIALLHRSQCMVDDDQADIEITYSLAKLFDLARSEQRRRPWFVHRHDCGIDDVEIDGVGKADRLGKTAFRRMMIE
jgi:hypothetical protein